VIGRLTGVRVVGEIPLVGGRRPSGIAAAQYICSVRREFDLSDRFDILQTKLDLLRDSHPFFLQVIHALQGHRMEIIIIALIAIEVVLGLLELYHRYA